VKHDDARWWLTLPPCPKCGLSHVLINCRERLPFEIEPREGKPDA